MPEAAPSSTALIALRDRREAAIQLLVDSFAGDLLTIDELDDRVARVHAAQSVAELDALVADLEPLAPPRSTQLVRLSIDPSLVASRKQLRTVFGNVERHGGWVVPDELEVRVVFGHVVLDLRDARFSAQTALIEARVVFGNLEIIVPPQLAVECEGSTLFGNLESHPGDGVPDPGRPLVRIHGRAVFGNIEVTMRLPGESQRDAHRRRRSERRRKRLARGAKPALPAGSGD